MASLILRRLLHAVAIVALATVASFALLHLAPGDPLLASVAQPGMSADARAELRARHGLDRPLPVQVLAYTAAVVGGDLGQSIVEQRPVAAVLADALPATLVLSGVALALAIVLGVATGTLHGWRPHDRVAASVGSALTLLYALPEIVLGVVLLALFGLHLGIFPVGGMADPMIELTGGVGARLGDRAWHLVLPAITLALAWGAALARQQRSAMREIAGEDFVRTARAKGTRAAAVLARHAMRPALPATVALIGTMLPVLAGGTVVVEMLFSWPGMGSLIVRGVAGRDYPLVAGTVIVVGAVIALGTLLADLVVLALDPRLRDGAPR